METIGNRIKNCRIKEGLSVEALAKKLDKNRSTLYRYENDEIEMPANLIMDIAKALEVNPAYLMGWVNDSRIDANFFNNRQELQQKQKLTDEENNLLEMFRNMNESQQFAVITLAEQLAEKYNEEEKRG